MDIAAFKNSQTVGTQNSALFSVKKTEVTQPFLRSKQLLLSGYVRVLFSGTQKMPPCSF